MTTSKNRLQYVLAGTLFITPAMLLSCEHDKFEEEETEKVVEVDQSTCTKGNPIEKTCTLAFNGVNFTMVKVPEGEFFMGCQSVDEEAQNYDVVATAYEGPVHKVKMSTYAIGETEVTQGLWEAVVARLQ